MTKDEMYKKQVISDTKEEFLNDKFVAFEEKIGDMCADVRETIEDIMETLYKNNGCTELVTEHYTIINRIGDVTIIHNADEDRDEVSIDDINMIDKLMDILNDIL